MPEWLKWLLAKVYFPVEVCEGHYDGCPSVPLVDFGRSMEQAAALFVMEREIVDHVKLPLFKQLSSLKGHKMERFRSGDFYWIWVVERKQKIITHLFSDRSSARLATVTGWEYELVSESRFLKRLQTIPAKQTTKLEAWESIDPSDFTPQSPPFFVLKSANYRQIDAENHEILVTAELPIDSVRGHLSQYNVLGPVHYSRVLAQTGMVLAAVSCGDADVIPEVASTGTIWHDTTRYYPPYSEIFGRMQTTRFIEAGNMQFVTVRGELLMDGVPACGTDGFNYVLVPRAKHLISSHI